MIIWQRRLKSEGITWSDIAQQLRRQREQNVITGQDGDIWLGTEKERKVDRIMKRAVIALPFAFALLLGG